jgi:ankyrin repeat protein
MSSVGPTEGFSSKSLLPGLPTELIFEVLSHLESFKDLNSLVRTSRFFHAFNCNLYRRAVAADPMVLDVIVGWVLSDHRLDSLTLLLDNGLSVHHTGRYLVHAGSVPHSRPEKSMLCFLSELRQNQSVPLARLLLQRSTDSRDFNTALDAATRHGNYPIVALLLEHGVRPCFTDMHGGLLHSVCRLANDDAEMVRLLIAYGADIEARSADGNTPLLLASQQHKAYIMVALLQHGANAGVRNNFGQTPLHHAALWFDGRYHGLAKALLTHGAIVEATDDARGETPLHWALKSSKRNMIFMMTFLLENGANANRVTKDGLTPLQCALNAGRCTDEIVLLLGHGVNVRELGTTERRQLYRVSAAPYFQEFLRALGIRKRQKPRNVAPSSSSASHA